MANRYPYVGSQGPIISVVNQLRKSFPKAMSINTLKKMGLAPKNEYQVIKTLKFLDILDKNCNRNEEVINIFLLQEDDKFKKEFSILVKKSYSDLFNLHGEETWNKDLKPLITFFRQSDQSSETVGKRQANTFIALAGLSGYGKLSEPKSYGAVDLQKKTKSAKTKDKKDINKTKLEVDIEDAEMKENNGKREFGLTVRIEINLPSGGDKETYDNIFKSIKENLLNG